MLDVIVMKAKNAFELLPAVFAAMLDRDGDFPERGDSLEIYQGKEVRVEADPAFEIWNTTARRSSEKQDAFLSHAFCRRRFAF